MIPDYLAFHAVFVLPAIGILWATGRRDVDRTDRIGTGILVVIALLYTVPWDGHLVRRGVWSYGAGSLTTVLWDVPLGEYLFICLQPVLTGLWVARLDDIDSPAGTLSIPSRIGGATAALSIGGVGLALLTRPDTYYLGAILAWSSPVLAIQWAFDWRYLWERRRTVFAGTIVPVLYLCVADRIAIQRGIWKLSSQYTTGVTVGGLPIEEGLFFLVTNLFVVQGLFLFRGLAYRAPDATVDPSLSPGNETVEESA